MSFIRILSSLIVMSCFSLAHGQVKPNISGTEPSAVQIKAKKLYERLTGTKVALDSPAISQIVNLMNNGDMMGAAKVATADPNFYNITVKLMALKMSTREETIKTKLNDFAASFIGITRDKRDARELLTGNFYYSGSGDGIRSNIVADILTSNNHYEDLEKARIDLSKNLVRQEGQLIATSDTATVASPDPAGVLTLRGFMGAHAIAGTNRRLVEYTFREFMCVPLDSWADTAASDARIGRDIDRFPAGDHNKFATSCKGCHTVMDGFRGAFAKWDFTSRGVKHSAVNPRGGGAFDIDVDGQGVVTKMNRNSAVFPSGYVTTNDSFINNATRPNNRALFEWRGPASAGNGTKAFGTIVANSRRFSQCMAKRVFETVCRKSFDAVKDRETLALWGDEFEASGYKLKNLFESVAVKSQCL